MKNETMGAEDLYLAPDETPDSDFVVSSEKAESETSKVVSSSETTKKSHHVKRIEERPELRGTHSKVFRMNDGTEQVVFSPSVVHVFDDETRTFEDVETTLTEEEDGKHYISGKNHFVAKFSCEENTDELFFIEKGIHKVTVYARKNKKNRNTSPKPVLRKNHKDTLKATDVLSFTDVETDTDYEYSVEGNGVKENIIVKKPSTSYCYPFALKCENVRAKFEEDTNRVAFISNETNNEVFFIPEPFMIDANGAVSTDVNFEIRTSDTGVVYLTVIADTDWMNASERAFPVAIDPQIKVTGSEAMTTYSWKNGKLSKPSIHTIGANGSDVQRMYIHFYMPDLPRNPRIKKAELVFNQQPTSDGSDEYPLFALYHDIIEFGSENTTTTTEELIDFAKMKAPDDENSPITYSFDITCLIDQVITDESISHNLVMKMMDETVSNSRSVTLCGSSFTDYAPTLVITYESSYGVNTSYRTHSHELGRFGQGSVDLQCGNLMFESEDFTWSGNRLPVTIKHLYTSALAEYQYTENSEIHLNAANFSSMKLGYGFKLNLMQSMKQLSPVTESTPYYEYVYVGENGEETYFQKNEKKTCSDTNGQCYYLYEDVNGNGMVYDPTRLTLTQGDDVYLFDDSDRLIRITDAFQNHIDVTYTEDQITSVTDGAGRKFGFEYDNNGFLTRITAPDNTTILYAYSGNLLSTITYPNGKKVSISYVANKPKAVTLLDASDNNTYKVEYTFTNNKLSDIIERGADGSVGATTTYSYSAAASTTTVTTVELRDESENETIDNAITTVYTFDDEGNIVSEYVYSTFTDNAGTNSEASGINPYAGEGGAGVVSNINNLLCDHDFENLAAWSEMPSNCGDFIIRNIQDETNTKFGQKYLYMQALNDTCNENGVFQVTDLLPAGKYTFSAYFFVESNFMGCNDPGAFIRVTDTDGNILGVSERLANQDISYTRLIVPFEITTDQSVQVQILTSGQGSVRVDGAQLENNPYANAYNMLDNGSFERGVDGWSCDTGAAYYSTDEHLNMRKSLVLNGNINSAMEVYQTPAVCVRQSTRETFTLSGWAKGYGLPNHTREGVSNEPKFELRAVITYTDGNTQPVSAAFAPCMKEWQFTSIQFSKDSFKAIESIRVYCDYSYNNGKAYFDSIQLVRNSLEKNLTAEDFNTTSSDSDTSTDENTNTTPTFNEATDAFGNTLTETTFTDGEFGTIYRSFKFNADDNSMTGNDAGNNLIEETDARGYKTSYTVDSETSRNEEVTDRLGNKTAYEYDTSGRTTKVTSKKADGTELANVSYSYDTFDNMTEIVRGDGMKYALAYNDFHNLESIGIKDKNESLIKYTYKNGNGRLKQMTYANGHTMKAIYNSLGQMVAEKWFASEAQANAANATPIAHYKYVYDGSGNIVRSIDIFAAKEYNYEYEEGRIVRANELDITLSGELVIGKSLVNTVKYYYNADDTMERKTITPTSGSAQTIYYEQGDDNTVVKFSADGRTVTSHSKTDSFGRKVFDELQLGTDFVSRQFVYYVGKVTPEHKTNVKVKSSATTQLVSQIILSNGTTLSYSYDAEERITSVIETYTLNDTSVTNTTLYTYDALGQLLTETVNDTVVNSMEYDNYGNIKTKNGVVYSYDTTWKDLLMQVGTGENSTISYDAQGNPTSYLGHTLTWEKGRQLKSFDGNTYTYNANGIRTSKTVGGVKHEYTLDGTKILREVWGNNTLIPLYDNEESVCGILYNNVPYYFIKNLQGDVIAIVNKDAQTVAKYSYDAWGVCTVTQDTSGCQIATINPFRYRGYYFDEEIGLYYLNSRYYNPEVGRFINGDDVMMQCSSVDSHGYCAWSYCKNGPVGTVDAYGYDTQSVLKEIDKYIGETWIARLLKKNISKIKNGKCYLFNEGVGNTRAKLYLEYKVRKPSDNWPIKLTTKSFEAALGKANFKLGWWGKLESSFGISIGRYTMGIMRGIDWKKRYISIYISYVTKDKKMEFTTVLFFSVSNLLILAVSGVVVGLCVVLPALAPAFLGMVGAFAAKAKIFASICTSVLYAMQVAYA